MRCPATPPPDAPDSLRVEGRWLTETVLALARGVAADVALDRLPILADALEEAGCDSFALLNHLRSDEPHEVGCWALRRLLRTTLFLPGDVPITFAYCPPGSFLMGSDPPEYADEVPVRRVTLTAGFHAGIVPVTQAQWRAVMGSTPSQFEGDRRPVEQVTWGHAEQFCRQAAGLTNRPLRLPTEAEWEYSCRAGTATQFWYGDESDTARMNCASDGTSDVGTFPPNPWGLFDTHGNVMEWCADFFDAQFYSTGLDIDPVGGTSDARARCCRGGSWRYAAGGCRSAHRNYRSQDTTENCVGFRVVFTAT